MEFTGQLCNDCVVLLEIQRFGYRRFDDIRRDVGKTVIGFRLGGG